MNQDELYHYGVKGMKWGVRRYRKEDGSLTSAGKARIRKIYALNRLTKNDRSEMLSEKKRIRKSGIIVGKDGVDTIKKGTTLGRFSSNSKETMDRRKYAFLTSIDKYSYKDHAKNSNLGAKEEKHIFEYRMKALSDLKVASGKAVMDRVITKYGDRSLKSAYREYKDLHIRENALKIGLLKDNGKTIPKKLAKRRLGEFKNDQWAGEYGYYIENKVNDGLHDLIYKNATVQSKLCKYYARRGYDAIVDAEDYVGQFDYPVILLNPEKSVRVQSVHKIGKTKKQTSESA